MSLGELAAATGLGHPILVVVVNDSGYGAEVHHFASLGLPTDLARLDAGDFAVVARAMGAEGVTVRGVDDLAPLRSWLDSPAGLMVLDCRVDPSVEGEYLREAFSAEA